MVARYFLFWLHEPEILRKSLLLMEAWLCVAAGGYRPPKLISDGNNCHLKIIKAAPRVKEMQP